MSGELKSESEEVIRLRQKILARWGAMEKQITPEALAKTAEKIRHWIAIHAHHRVTLDQKEIHLFDENQNAAHLSFKVQKIAKDLHLNLQ